MVYRIIKKIALLIGFVLISILVLIQCKVLWVLAPNYQVSNLVPLEMPIMSMKDYESIWDNHRRPYIYPVKSKSGTKVHIVGVEHTKDVNHPHLDSIRHWWNHSQPTIALVEDKVGNLFTWLQHPIEELGEGGLVTHLANKKGIPLYSWEPPKEVEIELLLEDFSAKEIALFYTIRPYFSNLRYGKPKNPEAKLQEYLESRTDIPPLEGIFKSWEAVDAQWQKDFPNYDWRNHQAGSGFPKGYLHDLWNRSNTIRDEYMIQIILETTSKQQETFVVMGVSHAPRIEATLKKALE